jgi:hypothetical protein
LKREDLISRDGSECIPSQIHPTTRARTSNWGREDGELNQSLLRNSKFTFGEKSKPGTSHSKGNRWSVASQDNSKMWEVKITDEKEDIHLITNALSNLKVGINPRYVR